MPTLPEARPFRPEIRKVGGEAASEARGHEPSFRFSQVNILIHKPLQIHVIGYIRSETGGRFGLDRNNRQTDNYRQIHVQIQTDTGITRYRHANSL